MADDAEVKLGADVGDLKSNTAEGATSVEASLAKIADALTALSAKSKKTSDDVQQHTNLIEKAIASLHENVRVRFGSINSIMETFNTHIAAIGLAFAGGALFKGAVDSMLRFEQELLTLENVLGLSSESATTFNIALKLAGTSADAFTGIALRMGRVLKTNQDEFTRLGVTIKDSNGDLLPMNQIMQNAFETMQTFKAGTDQAEFALSVFGRSVSEVYNIMARLPAAQERAIALQQELGIEMGPKRQAEIEAYRLSLNSTKVAFEAVGEKIGEAVLPQLQQLIGYFNDVGPAAAEFFVGAIKLVIATIDYLATGFKENYFRAKEWIENVVTAVTYGMRAFVAAIAGNWTEAVAIWKAGDEKILRNQLETNAKILGMEADLNKRLAKLFEERAKGGDTGPGPLKSGSRTFTPKPTAGDPMAEWDNILKASQNAYNAMRLDQGSFEVWSVDMTRDYWQQVVAMTTAGTKEHLEAQNKFYDAERAVQQRAFASYIAGLESQKAALGHNIAEKIAIGETEFAAIAQRYGKESPEAEAAYKRLVDLRQQLADQRQKIADIEAKAEEAAIKHEYEMARLGADQAIALRQISAQQRFAIEQDFLNKEHAAIVAKINADIAAMAADPTSDPTKLAALKAQLLKVEQDYQTNVTKIANQAELDRKAVALQAAADVENAFGTFIDDLISRNKSLKDSFKDLVKSITSDLNKLASQQIAKSLFGAGTGGGNFLNDIFGKIFGGGAGGAGATSDAATTAAHTTAVEADTLATTEQSTLLSTAFTALSTAAGTASAALAAVGTSGAAGGLGGGLSSLFGAAGDVASFDVGTPYVPQDTLAVVHKGEAIIPAAMNKGGAVATGPMHMHFYISGNPDSRTLDQIQAAAARGASKATRSVM
jgi:hypothetical protein